MNLYFWIALVVMTLGAVAFLLPSLLRRNSQPASASSMTVLLAAIIMPVLTVGLYAYLGTPKAAVADPAQASSLARMTQISNEQATQRQVASVANLVEGLAGRLEKNPDDAGGWLLLAKSYRHLDNRDGAADAYEHAAVLGKTDADIEAWLSSGGAAQVQSVGIHGRVTIDGDLLADVDGSASVFVVAKAASGSPVPLAVLRTTVASLPFDFNLHDGQAMVAGNKLSSADSVIVTAKVSADGDALSTVPGLEIHSNPVNTANPGFVSLHLGQ
jgi:hypothetical protein